MDELATKAAYFTPAFRCTPALLRTRRRASNATGGRAYVLGHLQEIASAASILRGFNGRLIIVYQMLGQAKEHFRATWGLFGGGATIAFRPADPETASYLVQRAGQETIKVRSASNPSRMGDGGPSVNVSQHTRDRIPLHAMYGMPQGTALVFLPGDLRPRISRVKGYFEVGLNRRSDPNPYYHRNRRGWFGFGQHVINQLISTARSSDRFGWGADVGGSIAEPTRRRSQRSVAIATVQCILELYERCGSEAVSTFLDDRELGPAITDLMQGSSLRCAVAFWGNGASSALFRMSIYRPKPGSSAI